MLETSNDPLWLVQLHTMHPSTDEAITFWASKDEPSDVELLFIEWNPKIYNTHRNSNGFISEEYEF